MVTKLFAVCPTGSLNSVEPLMVSLMPAAGNWSLCVSPDFTRSK